MRVQGRRGQSKRKFIGGYCHGGKNAEGMEGGESNEIVRFQAAPNKTIASRVLVGVIYLSVSQLLASRSVRRLLVRLLSIAQR